MLKNIIITCLNFVLLCILLFSCAKTENNLELGTFENGAVYFDEYLDHYLLSTKYKPDQFPTEKNLKEIVLLKANEKMGLLEAISEGIENDSLYINIVNNNERRLLYQKYVHEFIIDSIVTDSLIEKFYAEFSPQYRMKYIMRPIVETLKPEFIELQKDTIRIAYNKLLEGSDFGTVARKYSQDITTNKKGGDLGWMIPESMGDHIVRSVMDTLTKQTFSEPFRGFGGYYILYKGESREVKVPSFDSVRQQIWNSLYKSRTAYIQKNIDEKFDKLSDKYNLKTNYSKIGDILKKVGFKPGTSKYADLSFSKLTDTDKSEKIAEYNGGLILLGDLFADSKKSPINKFEFDKRLKNISEHHLFSLHAKEINLHQSGELAEQLKKMKNSLLRAILFQRKVQDKVDLRLADLGESNNPGVRNEIKNEIKSEYEDYLKTKYKFSFKEENFDRAIEIANEEKLKLNSNDKKIN